MADNIFQQLIQQQAIEALLIRYAHACDRRDWSLLETVFAEHIEVNYGGEFKVAGRDAVINMIQSMLGGCGPTQHLLGNFTIAVNGLQAGSSCYVRAVHEGLAEQRGQYYEVWAEYTDTLQWVYDRWLIVYREMKVHNEVGSRAVLAPA
ncbi:nuclear transport factor 2 family protein [Oceanicoccus sp. KOV_DT_Chl]|uniref:nuclear transport factor 2 family protein n=1 Tax=Oceanicoccus sp. KOV_DT_Chl TaxID=1904639 RepID=UPI001357FDD2|nr:nuclear transport factor 2 family protein [Oceanicoccus sp. KOV_DT_Chl]